MKSWKIVLELASDRSVISGSSSVLGNALGRGADLRICTEFRHNQHIDVRSPSNERIIEVAEFRVTYLIDGRWSAGIMSLRQPIQLPTGFGPRPSMSFFLYNENGVQALARPHLDGAPPSATPGTVSTGDCSILGDYDVQRFHPGEQWDTGTNAPCTNFVYDFDVYRFSVSDSWTEVLSHDQRGNVLSGSLSDLIDAFASGCELKIGVRGLCSELAESEPLDHELFVQAGPGYYYTEQKLFMVGSHPLIRVAPAIPMRYQSGNWDFGWLMVRTDGHVVYRRCDPHTLAFTDTVLHLPIRWFVR